MKSRGDWLSITKNATLACAGSMLALVGFLVVIYACDYDLSLFVIYPFGFFLVLSVVVIGVFVGAYLMMIGVFGRSLTLTLVGVALIVSPLVYWHSMPVIRGWELSSARQSGDLVISQLREYRDVYGQYPERMDELSGANFNGAPELHLGLFGLTDFWYEPLNGRVGFRLPGGGSYSRKAGGYYWEEFD